MRSSTSEKTFGTRIYRWCSLLFIKWGPDLPAPFFQPAGQHTASPGKLAFQRRRARKIFFAANQSHFRTLCMGIFSWILLGLIAGALAKFIMPGRDPGGIVVTILIGIAGAIVGGFLGSLIGLGRVESFDLGGIFIATLGAIVLLIVYRLLKNRS